MPLLVNRAPRITEFPLAFRFCQAITKFPEPFIATVGCDTL